MDGDAVTKMMLHIVCPDFLTTISASDILAPQGQRVPLRASSSKLWRGTYAFFLSDPSISTRFSLSIFFLRLPGDRNACLTFQHHRLQLVRLLYLRLTHKLTTYHDFVVFSSSHPLIEPGSLSCTFVSPVDGLIDLALQPADSDTSSLSIPESLHPYPKHRRFLFKSCNPRYNQLGKRPDRPTYRILRSHLSYLRALGATLQGTAPEPFAFAFASH